MHHRFTQDTKRAKWKLSVSNCTLLLLLFFIAHWSLGRLHRMPGLYDFFSRFVSFLDHQSIQLDWFRPARKSFGEINEECALLHRLCAFGRLNS